MRRDPAERAAPPRVPRQPRGPLGSAGGREAGCARARQRDRGNAAAARLRGTRARLTSVLKAAHHVSLQQPRSAGDAVGVGHLVEEIHHELRRLLAGQDVGRQLLDVEDLPQPLQRRR